MYRPGCLEHFVLNQLQNNPDFIAELDYVMELNGKLIGQNIFMKVVIKADNGSDIPIVTMGPICITPELKILSRNPDFIIVEDDAILTPLPIDDEISGLSAILLNEALTKRVIEDNLAKYNQSNHIKIYGDNTIISKSQLVLRIITAKLIDFF